MKTQRHTKASRGPKPDRGIWQEAAAISAAAHEGQYSPEETTPYFAHSARVSMLIATEFGCTDPEVLAAALLHDVLEKTDLPVGKIRSALGEKVTAWVEDLSKNVGGPETYWDRLRGAPWQSKLIKLADALDHLNGPVAFRTARLKTARKALALASSGEPELRLAAERLSAEIERLSAR